MLTPSSPRVQRAMRVNRMIGDGQAISIDDCVYVMEHRMIVTWQLGMLLSQTIWAPLRGVGDVLGDPLDQHREIRLPDAYRSIAHAAGGVFGHDAGEVRDELAPALGAQFFDDVDRSWQRVSGGRDLDRLLDQVEHSYALEAPHVSVPALLDALGAMNSLADHPWKDCPGHGSPR